MKFHKSFCIHHVFETQAKETPNALAVIYQNNWLTYRQLNNRANQVAHYLRTIGVGPEVAVGLCLERSCDLLVGMLGILKAGGAYVPLEPKYPNEYLDYMIRESNIRVLLTQDRLKENLPHHRRVILLDAESKIIKQYSKKNPHSEVTAQNIAYIIYTSGSSGKPKGVMVCHANIIELFRVSQPYFSFSDKDIWMLFHSFAFGFSVWEIWGALFYGARLVIVPHEVSQSPVAFYKMVCKKRITVLCQTPSAFRLFEYAQRRLNESHNSKIRYIIFSGESLEPYHVASWIARHGDCFPKLVNMYALTETSGAVAYKRIRLEDLEKKEKGWVGRPFPGIKIYICDENMNNPDDGEIGEIYVSGGTIARGYIERPDLTAAKFI